MQIKIVGVNLSDEMNQITKEHLFLSISSGFLFLKIVIALIIIVSNFC